MERNEKPIEIVDKKDERPRFHFLDALRGIMIIGVVINHFLVDLEALGFSINVLENPFVEFILNFGRFMFVFLAGITCNLSRNNLKRGMICLGFAFGITLVTYLFMREYLIYVGILHLLGFCMVLFALLEKLNLFTWIKHKKTSSALGMVLLLMLYIITHAIYYKTKGLWLFSYIPISESPLYGSFLGYILGFGGYQVGSADYFPLIPWAFIFFSGVFAGYFFKHNLVPKLFQNPIFKPLTLIGRHTLLIYVLHQPIAWGIAQLLALWLLG